MKQYSGLVLGGMADGQRQTASMPTMEFLRRPPRNMSWIESQAVQASDVQLERQAYRYQEHWGLGFWIPYESDVTEIEGILTQLYLGYKGDSDAR